MYTAEGFERALSTNSLDLWPLSVDLPERRRFLYISSPWAKLAYAVVSLPSLPIHGPQDVGGKTLAATVRIASDARVIDRYFRHASVIPQYDSAGVISAVCSGAAATGLLAINPLRGPQQSTLQWKASAIAPHRRCHVLDGIGSYPNPIPRRTRPPRCCVRKSAGWPRMALSPTSTFAGTPT